MTVMSEIEIESRATALLVNVLVGQLPSATLSDLADSFEATLGMEAPHPAYERDHAINEAATERIVKMLRTKVAGAPANDRFP